MRHKNAFTLIELIMALAVMASVSILVLPALFGRSHQEQRLIDGTDQWAEVLRTARQQAIDQATPICVSIIPGTANYRCWVMRDPSICHVGAMPAGITLHPLRKNSQGQVYLEVSFREDGTATSNEFEVRGPQASKRVVVERLTGQVTVAELEL